jgi:fucose permease
MRKNTAILIAYLCYIAVGTFDGLLGVIWPAMSADFGVPLGSLGILLLVALVGFVLVSFNNGPLIRALSFHKLLLLSLAVRAAGFALLAVYPSWPMAIAMIFLMSLGGAGIDSGLNTFLSEHGTARQLNWLHASFGIGATMGPFLAAGVLAAGGQWTWNLAIVAAFLATLALLVWRTAPLWQITLPRKTKKAGKASTKFTASLRMPVVWVSTALFFFYVGTELTAGQWSFSLFTLGRGMPDLSAKFWVGIYWGIFTVGRLLFGLVADRVQIDRFLRFTMGITILGALLLWLNPFAGAAIVGLVVMGMAEAPIYPSLIAGTALRVGKAHAANTIGFQVAAAGVGGTLLTGVVGLLATEIGLEAIGAAAFVFAAVTWLAFEGLLRAGKIKGA